MKNDIDLAIIGKGVIVVGDREIIFETKHLLEDLFGDDIIIGRDDITVAVVKKKDDTEIRDLFEGIVGVLLKDFISMMIESHPSSQVGLFIYLPSCDFYIDTFNSCKCLNFSGMVQGKCKQCPDKQCPISPNRKNICLGGEGADCSVCDIIECPGHPSSIRVDIRKMTKRTGIPAYKIRKALSAPSEATSFRKHLEGVKDIKEIMKKFALIKSNTTQETEIIKRLSEFFKR